MALSGSFYGTTANSLIQPKIQWSATQSVAGNYSDITATLSYSRTNTGYTTGGAWSGSLSIGTNKATATKAIDITYNSNTVAITHNARVYHDDAGNLSVTISATGAIAGSSLSSTTISATVTLDTIARASTLSATNADIGSRSTVVVDRKSGGFTHCVAYDFGGLQGYILSDGSVSGTEVRFSATTVNFLVPESFYTKIPNSASGVCTLTCRTYSGSTQIGDAQTARFTVTAPKSLCAPTVSAVAVDVNETTKALTGSDRKIVRELSVVRCTLTAEAKNSATVASVNIGGEAIGGYASANVTATREFSGVTGAQIQVQATDSRGYTATGACTVDFVPYVLLTNNATVRRTDPTSGNAVLQLKGNCWQGNFGAVENALALRYQVGAGEVVEVQPVLGENHTYTLEIPLSGLDYTLSHVITVWAQDKAMQAEKKLTVQKGVPVFDWGEQDFRFHVPVSAPAYSGRYNGVYMDTIRVWNGKKTFSLQSKYTSFDNAGDNRQTVLLFGTANSGAPVLGVLTIWSNGVCQWCGTDGVSAQRGNDTGAVTVTLPAGAFDMFTLLSADYFKEITI